MKRIHYIISFVLFFALILCIFLFPKKNNNTDQSKKRSKSNSVRIIYSYEYVDQYNVDSTGMYLIKWNGDTVKKKTKK